MSFLLDTDVCSAYLKGNHAVGNRVIQYGGRLYVSTITVGELFAWVLRTKSAPRRLQGLLDFLNDVSVLDVDTEVSRQFGEVQASLLDLGQPAPGLDLCIAATALVHGLTLVSHNRQDFDQIPGLALMDWLGP